MFESSVRFCSWQVKKIPRLIFTASALAILLLPLAGAEDSTGPGPEQGLLYSTPALTWDEALPLANGMLGALVWGDGRPLRISLDRTDLWDLRPVPQFASPDYSYQRMRQWVAEGRIQDLHRLYDDPYGNPGPTKIPAGRIELRFPAGASFDRASLDVAEAVARVDLSEETGIQVLVHARRPVGLIRLRSRQLPQWQLLVPPFSGTVTDPAAPGKISAGDLTSLGYPPAQAKRGADWAGFLQPGWGGFSFAVALVWKTERDGWLAAWSVATSKESADPLRLARQRCTGALALGFEQLLTEQRHWWRAYWAQSWVQVPNATLERQWFLDMYKFGAAARSHTPPISLQGPWTADDGRIPPWKGDYHHDLNTELSYWPCYSGNRLEAGLGYLNWLWQTRARGRDWTRRFFGVPGLNVPMTADLDGNQIGGWHQYTHSATTAAWLAQHFYLHWRYSADRGFLRRRAFPYLREAALFLEAVAKKGNDGKRRLPLSSSPEINDDRLEAWFPSTTNFDLALIRWLFAATAELARELGDENEAQHWLSRLAECPDFALDAQDGRLLVAAGLPLAASHRHFSHLMAIHPLGLIRWENGGRDRRIIEAALAELERLGSSQWCGYSFAWYASLAARARRPELAEKALEIFSSAFCLRNSFHCNGDQSGKGHSGFTYRPFTLEGNFAAAAALQEMLLQSYSGTVRLFPAIPTSWQEVSFNRLRAEGAFLVSAWRSGGRTRRVEIVAEQGGRLRMEDPFAGEPFVCAGRPRSLSRADNGDLLFLLKRGEQLMLRRSN